MNTDEVKVSIYIEGLGMKIAGMFPISKAREIVDFAVDSLIELNQKPTADKAP
jgi:hypothetical protein